MTTTDKTIPLVEPDAKWLKKRAFALYKKHVTGRGYVWPVGCSMPDDVQAAITEGMREAYAAAQPAIARAVLEDAPVFDDAAVAWAYGKCIAFGLESSSTDSAMMMDRLKLLLGGYGY